MAIIRQVTEEQIREKYDELALRLGNVVIAWNTLYESLGGVFALVINGNHASIPLAAWHSLRADRSQREMLDAVAKAAFKKNHLTRERILWLIKKVNSLEDERNKLIHSPYIAANGNVLQMKPNAQSGNKKATQLVGKNLVNECAVLEARIDTLTLLARGIARHLQTSDFPLPPEPAWPPERHDHPRPLGEA